jgi:leader peptidase (prepilin peptidase)/N-methyltransferase
LLTLLQHPVYGLVFLGLVGACIGSFLNVVILRLPVMLQNDWRRQCAELQGEEPDSAEVFNLSKPASHCPACGAGVRAWQNIPIISYLLLRGRCASCGTGIHWRYPAVEIITALATVHLAWHFGIGWQLLASLFLIWSLIALTVIDIDHQLLPDSITLPLLWGGLIANLFGLFTSLESAVIGALAGYLGFWVVYQVHFRLTGREGLGYGDFKLLAALGAWLGWEMLPMVVLLSSLTGTLIAVGLMLGRGLDRRAAVSFGPFLALGGWATLLWGEHISRNYLQLFSFQ